MKPKDIRIFESEKKKMTDIWFKLKRKQPILEEEKEIANSLLFCNWVLKQPKHYLAQKITPFKMRLNAQKGTL